MTLKDWPAAERPRERLLAKGAAVLSDAELLAIFLGSGSRGEDAVARGRRMLDQSGGLTGLMQRARGARNSALPTVLRCRLIAAAALGERLLMESLGRDQPMRSPQEAAALFATRLRGASHEIFAAAFLDAQHRLIAFEELFQGSISGAEVHPRRLVERCLAHTAAAVLIGHNHPSGVSEPSQSDRLVTQRIREALALIDVRLLDHFIVGEGPPLSMATRGLI